MPCLGTGSCSVGNLHVEESAENIHPSSRNMMTLQGTVRELRKNPENGTIEEVAERVYGDNINIYIYNNITHTPLWTDNAIPIYNHRWSGIQLHLIPPC